MLLARPTPSLQSQGTWKIRTISSETPSAQLWRKKHCCQVVCDVTAALLVEYLQGSGKWRGRRWAGVWWKWTLSKLVGGCATGCLFMTMFMTILHFLGGAVIKCNGPFGTGERPDFRSNNDFKTSSIGLLDVGETTQDVGELDVGIKRLVVETTGFVRWKFSLILSYLDRNVRSNLKQRFCKQITEKWANRNIGNWSAAYKTRGRAITKTPFDVEGIRAV